MAKHATSTVSIKLWLEFNLRLIENSCEFKMQFGIRVDFNYGKNSCGLKFNWTFVWILVHLPTKQGWLHTISANIYIKTPKRSM